MSKKASPQDNRVFRAAKAPATPETPRRSRSDRRLGFECLDDDLETSVADTDFFGEETSEILLRLSRSSSPSNHSTSPLQGIDSTISEAEASVSYLEVEEEPAEETTFDFRYLYDAFEQVPTQVKWLLLGIIVLVLFSFVSERHPNNGSSDYNDHLKVLLRKHNITDRLSQKAIALSLKRLKYRPFANPQVILFASRGKDNLFLTDFSQLVKKIVNTPVAYLDSSIFSTRMDLDFTVHKAISKEQIIVLKNIERLVGDCPLVLHSVCDPDSATFPDSIILLSVQLGATYSNHSECEETVSRILVKHWSLDLEKSKVSAVVSRAMALVVCG